MRTQHSREPVTYTCPDIDRVIKSIRSAVGNCNLRGHESEEDLRDIIDDINNDLYRLDDKMEDLRKSNESLRSWGTEEAERVYQLEELLNEANKTITELKEEINNRLNEAA